jgi:enoyl-CoA hydratase/carnithine racemase
MSEDRIRVIRKDGIADVRLNRPDKMNALDPAMFEALVETGRDLADDRSVRVVVLSGEGRAFSAGLDMSSMAAIAGSRGAAGVSEERPKRQLFDRDASSPANFAQQTAWVWRDMPAPVIAAVHGVAYGGGLQIALGADIRFVAPDAKLSIRESHWGLIPDMAGSQLLRGIVRPDVAKELTFTARIISGEEAHALGLATHVTNTPYESAMELAREIAAISPDAVRAAKQLLNEAPLVSPEVGLQREEVLQRRLAGSRNQMEAVKAAFEKRAPRFEDPA